MMVTALALPTLFQSETGPVVEAKAALQASKAGVFFKRGQTPVEMGLNKQFGPCGHHRQKGAVAAV